MSIETITGTVDADAVTAEAVMDDAVTAEAEIVPISYSEGGSSVVVNPVQTDGTKIAEITVDQHQFDIFAPAGMHRYILRLVAVGGTWQIQDYYSGTYLSFADVKAAISDVNNYVVCVYGASKLRPQYVSTNELMMIGLDRASSESKILRILMTPTATTYTTYALAEKSDLTSGVSALTINGTELPKDDDGVVEIPKSNGQTFGLVKSGTGVSSTNGTLNLVQASDYGLNNRTNTGAITPPILDKAVLASLTDGKSASLWTADKQAAARALLGVGGSGGGDEWTYTTFTTTEDTDAITVDIPTDFNELFLSFTNAITNASSGYKYAYCNFTGTQQGKMISTHGNMNIYVGSYKPSYRFRLERVGGSAFLVSYTVGNYASINTSYFPIIVDFGGQESSGKIILHTFNTNDKFLAGTVVELAYK